MEGASVLSLCEMGDRLILEETSKVYKKEKEMKKGEEERKEEETPGEGVKKGEEKDVNRRG